VCRCVRDFVVKLKMCPAAAGFWNRGCNASRSRDVLRRPMLTSVPDIEAFVRVV